jgi:hypothetical protein
MLPEFQPPCIFCPEDAADKPISFCRRETDAKSEIDGWDHVRVGQYWLQ